MHILIALCLALFCATPGAAQEVVVAVQTEADGSRTLVHTMTVPATADDVWTAVATVEGWETWAVPLARIVPNSERFETSYNPSASPGAPDTIEQEWLEREAPGLASFRTTRTPEGFPNGEAYKQVTSTFTLSPAGPEATEVRLTSRGYPAGAQGDALVGFFREGNRMTLEQLHHRFTSGPVDWRARLGRNAAE